MPRPNHLQQNEIGRANDSPQLDEFARRGVAMPPSIDEPSVGDRPVESDLVHTRTVWTIRARAGARGPGRWGADRPASQPTN
jgi:hypothetical protein